ncbi:MAG: NAAT family transporter [Burkholderiales bacterium]|nr:NAAT family transporter [Burkholderiales bacterium]
MDNGLVQFTLTAFVTLLVVVDPVGVAPMFVAMTGQQGGAARRATLGRAVVIALTVTLFFLLAGRPLLALLGVTVHAFAISGGILLFATAMPMLFGHRPVLQGPERGEFGREGDDVAVFPLAIPLLCGPGAIASILLLGNQAAGQPAHIAALIAATVAVYASTWLILRTGQWLMMQLGEQRIHIVTRVLGLILAALAVQFVLDGITQYYATLSAS